MGEYPLCVRFLNEKAIDVGGVSRDMFAAFYDQAYIKVFDGNNLLTPVIHPHLDLSSLVAVGTIFSHAYVVCGMLPVRIAFPSLVCGLMGTGISKTYQSQDYDSAGLHLHIHHSTYSNTLRCTSAASISLERSWSYGIILNLWGSKRVTSEGAEDV